MFSLTEDFDLARPDLKCNYLRTTPASLAIVNEVSSHFFFDILREDSVIPV